MAWTPIHFNARSVCTAALNDLGVGSPGEAIDANEMQDAFRRLNQFVSQLRLQEFTVPFVSRQVFPMTAQRNTYTIGPGGDFDTQRPQSIEGAGLLLSPGTGSFAITGASPTLRTFTVAGDQTGSLPSGSDFTVSGSTGNNGVYSIVSAVYGSSTTITVSEAVASAVADGTINVLADLNATTEIPITLITDQEYQAIQVKGMGNTQWTVAYYNPTYQGGLGLLWVWPKPTTAINAMVLYLDQYVDGFANLTTEYSFPPGYFDLFEYGVAMRSIAPYGLSNSPIRQDIQLQFSAASALVKRQNVKRNDMMGDYYAGTGRPYNILTDGN